MGCIGERDAARSPFHLVDRNPPRVRVGAGQVGHDHRAGVGCQIVDHQPVGPIGQTDFAPDEFGAVRRPARIAAHDGGIVHAIDHKTRPGGLVRDQTHCATGDVEQFNVAGCEAYHGLTGGHGIHRDLRPRVIGDTQSVR